MSTKAAEDHYNWRIKIGHHDRAPNWVPGCNLLWDTVGYGCLVHPQIVLTSLRIWEKAERNRYGYDVMAKACDANALSQDQDKPVYKCRLGHADKSRDLAAIVLDENFLDDHGIQPKNFPQVAEDPPTPGQVLCVLSLQSLTRRHDNCSSDYVCFTFGSVCLLRKKSELLFALSGILTNEQYLGAAVFDEGGKVYGVVTDYLEHFVLPEHRDAAAGAGRFVVFSPIYGSGKKILTLPFSRDTTQTDALPAPV